jgi:hypothetical protein
MPSVGDKIKRTNSLKSPDAPAWEIVDQKGGWYHCKNLKSGKIEKVPTTALKSFSVVNESKLKTIARLLREAKDEEVKGEDSLDAQIDRYLTDYESEAKNSKNEGFDFRMMTRRFLVEADEDEKEEKKDDKEEAAAAPAKLSSDDINLKSFVTDVMRLVDNYENLLEVRNTILRRAANHLSKNYSGDVTEAFKEELLESYGVEIGVSKSEREDELEFQPPKAGAAGPAGGGGA